MGFCTRLNRELHALCATPSLVNLLSPWILVRLGAGLASAALFAHSAWVGLRVLRYFRLGATSEGQLALERQFELASASARVGAFLQASALLLSLSAADQLAPQLRGAMCGYGVVHATSWGPAALTATAVASLLAWILWRLLSLDRRVRSLAMMRPLAVSFSVVAAASLLDLALTAAWLGALDFTVVSSCCSSGLDEGSSIRPIGYGTSIQSIILLLAPPALVVAALLAWRGSKINTRSSALWAGFSGLIALPPVLAAIPLIVAPYVYETPHHRCPYCLFRSDALWMGYPLLAALLLAASSSLGAALASWLTPREGGAFESYLPSMLRTSALAWITILALSLAPVIRFLVLSGGIPLF